MIVGAQQIMHALRRMVHVGIRLARRVNTTGNVFAAAATPQVRDAPGLPRPAWPAHQRLLNGSAGGPANGALIQRDRPEHVGRSSAHHAATELPKIMPEHGVDMSIAERRHQSERVAHQIGEPERGEVAS